MRIIAEDTLALIIDVQEKLVPAMAEGDKCLSGIKRLIEGFKLLQVPFIVTQQYTKGLGMTVDGIRDCIEDFSYLDKISFSSYEEEKIKVAIGSFKRKNIILCGMEAHVCVQQTAIDLKAAGYEVVVVADCISSRKKEDMEIALRRFEYENIMLSTCESLLFELTRKAGSTTFKSISNLIK